MRGNQSESLGGLLQPGLPAGRPAGAAVRANAAARARGVASGAGVGAAACAAPLRAVRLSPDRSRPAPAAPDLPWRLHCLAPVGRSGQWCGPWRLTLAALRAVRAGRADGPPAAL